MSLDNYATNTCEGASACQKAPGSAQSDTNETVNIVISDTTFTVNRQQVIDNSTLICNAFAENPSEGNIQLPTIAENGWTKEFGYFVEFLKYKYFEIPTPLPERGVHFTKENCGSVENVNFINNFYDKTVVNEKTKIPEELTKSLCLANYLGATKYLSWCCAKYASVLVELGLAKVD
jgi:hypothetical protein